ncbi:EAL domain-containing protein [Paracoccus lutimaris]|uniref:EAL domain-containing protein (Putative c-di-GMP-specific phosphodiesterase class I) n=1 Tax=Paracoccus lutimaris TaxID=1490030 RepID=A0A368YR40_9RHOB|nr:EAL domain-containing protein [Paracoccus lutimaris]RCW82048.1 EAL domain-containing protein (putative c-di-GMP-specific phosphodiesterase class I) [Paracoccus lutimaris]
MAYGIGAAASRLARLVKGGAEGQGRTRLALVVQLENPETLCASLGPALFDRMIDKLTLRLATELRLIPQSRAPGAAEIRGVLADPRGMESPDLILHLQQICQTGIDLPEIRIAPAVNAVIISEGGTRHELCALYARGAAALRSRDPLGASGRVMFVEMPGIPMHESQHDTPTLVDNLRLNFQPQLCCDTGEVTALRVATFIDHPERGRLALAELQSRLDPRTLTEITRAALRQALTALRGWDRLGMRVPFVSMQIPDRELAESDIADAIIWELDRQDLAPDRLELEVSDPIGRMGGRLPVSETLQRLAAHGCRIALGNFGSGSAGLADLRQFGIRRVRIGREFIAECDRREDQQHMILAVVALAEHLRLTTLADGVDTAEEYAFLAQIGFNAVQGRAVAPLLDAGGIDAFLIEYNQSLPVPFDTRRGL